MTGESTNERPTSEAIHEWFGLSYANYLVMPRSLLQSMPDDWQQRFVGLLHEWDKHWGWDSAYEPRGGYRVHVLDERGRFAAHAAPHYERGRVFVTPRPRGVSS